ncbi:hypothetical protein [Powai lake megavirus]|uniref:Uncharacterized protein n=1 Tax=Powai lake megavirus TaxID=1842663 RepID=A0A167RCB7_9VIRU|nr:hypothetical protein QJ849_gp362 [Powai lake megavirus]ANB50524.1 hypothetical protein [Powai lake megavirus]
MVINIRLFINKSNINIMKLLYFLLLIFVILIIVIIYYSQKQKKPNFDDNKFTNNKSKNKSQNKFLDNSKNKSKNKFIDLTTDTDEYYDKTNNIYDLINDINYKYSTDVEFNMANSPIIGQIDKNLSLYISKMITHKLKKDINKWNYNFFNDQNKIILSETIILNLIATIDEFMVELLGHFFIEKKDYFIKLCYHGKKNTDIDFFSNNNNTYIITMCDIEMSDDDTYLEAINKNNTQDNVFMTMSEQMKYVNKINIMHREEME